MYLVPLVLIVTSGQRERERGGGQLGMAAENAPISGSRWRDQDCARGDYMNSMCPRDDFLLEKR